MTGKFGRLRQWRAINQRLASDFGKRTAWFDFLYTVVFRKKGKYGHRYNRKFHDAIKDKLRSQFANVIREAFSFSHQEETECDTNILPIWIFWWQGLETAPEIVRLCYRSVLLHANGHPVIVLDQDNFEQYADIPRHILDHLHSGNMTITYFSDILRCQLLYQRGGIWLDATLFLTEDIGDRLKDKSFYTIRHGHRSGYHVCKGKWSSFCMMAVPKLKFFKYLTDMFYVYWGQFDYSVCYLLIDCFIAIGYENFNPFQKLVDDVTSGNEGVFDMASFLNEAFNSEIYEELKRNSSMHKLSYRHALEQWIGKKPTLYHHILEEFPTT